MTTTPILATLDLLYGGVTITLDNGETLRQSHRRGEDPTTRATRRLVNEGYQILSRWAKTSAITWTVTIQKHPQACQTCITGCDCEVDAGCPHYGCWGDSATATCDYAAIIRDTP